MARMYSRKEAVGKNNNSKSCHYQRLIEGILVVGTKERRINESLKRGRGVLERTQRNESLCCHRNESEDGKRRLLRGSFGGC
jgi:hypothetical protein